MRRVALDGLYQVWNQIISLFEIHIHRGKCLVAIVAQANEAVVHDNEDDAQ